MSENLNSKHNRVVWVDIPCVELERAANFYGQVLAVDVIGDEFGGTPFYFLDHEDGNGGCLIESPAGISSDGGILVYFNVDGRIRDAVQKIAECGGAVVEEITSIGPHGFHALATDSEGNRVALHSNSDA